MVRVLALVVVLSGCDLIFKPAPGNLDAPASTDGAGSDGPIADASGDGATADAMGPDGPRPDASCAYVCNAPEMVPDTPNIGIAGCAPAGFCTDFPVLNSIALCTCSAGQPELHVVSIDINTIQIGLVAPLPPTGMFSLTVDSGACLGGLACPAAGCPGGTFLWVWDAVPITPGPLHAIDLFEDDGSGCVAALHNYTVAIP